MPVVYLLLRWIVHAVVLWLVVQSGRMLGLGLQLDGFGSALIAVFALGCANTLIRPLVKLLLLPLNCLTFGLLGLVVNILMLGLVAWLVPGFKLGGVVGTVYCWVLISFFGAIVNKLVRRQEES